MDHVQFVARHEDELCMVLMGPGFGESVLLRVPGRDWIVIDGCQHGNLSYPARFLADLEARPELVILTHPHLDHVLGLGQVLERAPASCIIGCYGPVVEPGSIWVRSDDSERKLKEGTREHVLFSIFDRWENTPSSRWNMVSGSHCHVGHASFQALHPPEGAPASSHQAANDVSSAVFLTWKSCRILLGADLPTSGWDTVASNHAPMNLHDHHGLKVPHHGSVGAIHAVWASGERARLWLLTPWNRGEKLPRPEDGEGLARLLGYVDAVHLTGLPVVHDQQAEAPCETTRQDLRDRRKPVPRVLPFFPGLEYEELDVAPPLAPRCWIAAAFGPDGRVSELAHGPGSVIVRDGSTPGRTP